MKKAAPLPEPRSASARDSFEPQFEAIEADIKAGHVLDYNGLPYCGKQAADALVEGVSARFAIVDGRKVVQQAGTLTHIQAFLREQREELPFVLCVLLYFCCLWSIAILH